MIKITAIHISEKEIELVTSSLRSGHLVQGQLVERFEKELAQYVGVSYAVAVNSGTAALHVALHAIGISEGDEVITTPFSFVATANTILMCGGVPVFADIDPDTFALDPHSVESLITSKTKAILAVDLYGHPVNYDGLRKICDEHKLTFVADSCQALGAEYDGKKVGAVADISVFSLYASKNVFSGEGGIITTDNEAYAHACRLFRNHGQTPGKQYEYNGLGYNYRLTDILASIVLPQISSIDAISAQRRANAEVLTKRLQKIKGLTTPVIQPNTRHCFHQYTLKITSEFGMNRDELQRKLLEAGIETRVYYPQLLTAIPHLVNNSRSGNTPNALRIIDEVVSIPVHQHLSSTDLDTIATTIETLASHE